MACRFLKLSTSKLTTSGVHYNILLRGKHSQHVMYDQIKDRVTKWLPVVMTAVALDTHGDRMSAVCKHVSETKVAQVALETVSRIDLPTVGRFAGTAIGAAVAGPSGAFVGRELGGKVGEELAKISLLNAKDIHEEKVIEDKSEINMSSSTESASTAASPGNGSEDLGDKFASEGPLDKSEVNMSSSTKSASTAASPGNGSEDLGDKFASEGPPDKSEVNMSSSTKSASTAASPGNGSEDLGDKFASEGPLDKSEVNMSSSTESASTAASPGNSSEDLGDYLTSDKQSVITDATESAGAAASSGFGSDIAEELVDKFPTFNAMVTETLVDITTGGVQELAKYVDPQSVVKKFKDYFW